MTAIIAGQGLGLLNTSLGLLGGQGQLGEAAQGSTGERVLVNAATGNLVVQQQDEWLVGVGPDVAISRTYNSLGNSTDDNGDNWRLGLNRVIKGLSGTINTAGSTITRVADDGSETVYTYDTAKALYLSKDGGGGFDTLGYNAGVWTWTDGSTQTKELYTAISGVNARLSGVFDVDGNKITLAYANATSYLITEIVTASASTASTEKVAIVYDTVAGKTSNILSLTTSYLDAQGALQSLKRVSYTYETYNTSASRLKTVTVDLKPVDAQATTTYVTTYTYIDSVSTKLASIGQKDGTKVNFTYDASGRVQTFSQIGMGQTLTTTLAYDTVNGKTTVTDALGLVSELSYSVPTGQNQRQLTQIKRPAVAGFSQSTQFNYDTNGNVTSVIDPRGNATVYRYDANGNRTYERDATGSVTERVYGATNLLTQETTYTVVDPDGEGTGLPSGAQTTRYVYDAKGHLRFAVSPQKRVTEYKYNSLGQQTSSIAYGGAVLGSEAITESALATWAGAQDLTRTQRTEYSYNSRSQLNRSTTYAVISSAGVGSSATNTDYVYDQAGNLLNRLDNAGHNTSYVYDGLNRVVLETNALSQKRSTIYLEFLGHIVATVDANGQVLASTYNTLGQLSTVERFASLEAPSSGATTYAYDKLNRLRMVTTPTGEKTFYLYDEASRKVGEIDPTGALTQYVYNADNQLVRTRQWVNKVSASTLAALAADPSSGALPANLSSNTFAGWTRTVDGAETSFTNGSNFDANWTLSGEPTLWLRQVGTEAISSTLGSANLNVTAGKTYEVSAYTGAHRATASLEVAFYNSQGVQIGGSVVPTGGVVTNAAENAGGTTLAGYKRLWGKVTAPVGATFARVVVRKAPTNAGQTDSYLFVAHPYLGEAPATQTLVSGFDVRPAADTANDRINLNLYDLAGRMVKTIDAAGAVVKYVYDGAGQLTETLRYGNLLTPTQLAAVQNSATEVLSSSPDTVPVAVYTDRSEHRFYNADGLLEAQFDGNGAYAENTYDAAGRLTKAIRYANWVVGVNGLPDMSVKPVVTATAPTSGNYILTDAANDQVTQYVYSNQGRLVGLLDAEGYYTRTNYDAVGNKSLTIRYANKLQGSFDGKNAPALLASGTASPTSGSYLYTSAADDHINNYFYDELNRLSSTWSRPEWAAVGYEYDAAGNLTSQTRLMMAGLERTTQSRYDPLGRLTATLSAEGTRKLLDWVQANPTAMQEQIAAQTEAIWAGWSTRYAYDNDNRLLSLTEPDGSGGAGLKTCYYYDAVGRKTASINALGEVTQYKHNTFGEIIAQTQVGKRLDATTLAGLSGGRDTAVTTAIASLITASAGNSSTIQWGYDQRGMVSSMTDALSNTSTHSYTAFGQLFQSSDKVDATRTLVSKHYYDLAGRQTFVLQSGTGIATRYLDSTEYDSFGRVVSTYDPNFVASSYTYDRLGRQVRTEDRLGATQLFTYDAFDRVLTSTDAQGKVTSYVYDSVQLKQTVTTPEGVVTSMVRNDVGQVVSVTDGQGTITAYTYNLDDQLTGTSVTSGSTVLSSSSVAYDQAGRVFETKDGRGIVTRTTYDAANRVLKRVVEPDGAGLKLTNEYRYDAKGQGVWAKDANGVWTKAEFDLKGQLKATVVDPASIPNPAGSTTDFDNLVTNASGLNLRTEYTYDALGHTLTVIEGAQTPAQARTTQYAYDTAGRRTSETIDPGVGKLNLTTTYTYDKKDNVVARTDAKGNVTRYVYDAENRLGYTVDATGAVSYNEYDLNGRLSRTTAYANRIELGATTVNTVASPAFGLVIASTDITARLTKAAARDQATRYVYDKDGRLTDSIDALGYVTRRAYDKTGHVTKLTRYAKAATSVAETAYTYSRISFTAPAMDELDANNQIEQTVYDGAGRATWSIDALGYATQRAYDANGNVTQTTRYSAPLVFVTGSQKLLDQNRAPIVGTSTTAGDSTIVANAAKDQTSYTVYDSANRATFSIDAEKYVTQNSYDSLGRVKTSTRYAKILVNAYVSGVAPQVLTAAPGGTPSYVLKDTANDATTTHTYDKAGRLTDVQDAELNTTRNVYDAAGRITETTVAYGSVTDASTTRYVYDAAGRVTDEVKAYGKPEQANTRYVLDALGQRIQIIDPRGVEAAKGTSTWAIAERVRILGGNTATRTTPPAAGTADYLAMLAAYATKQDFDANGRVIVSTDPAGRTIKTDFDAFGNVVKVTDPANNPGYFYFDKLNQATWSVDPMGYAVQTEFNGFGQATKITRYVATVNGTQSAAATPVAYDNQAAATAAAAAVYVLRTTGKDQITQIDHDKLGQQTKITDAEGFFESMTYDGLGNKSSYTQKSSTSTVNDPTKTGTYTYTHDRLGRVLTETAPETSGGQPIRTAYAYDARGNVTQKTEAQGLPEQRITRFKYDRLDQQVEQRGEAMTNYTVAGGVVNNVEPVETRTYDKRGNLIEVKAADGGRTLTYWDASDLKLAEVSPMGTLTTYGYDKDGNLLSQKVFGDAIVLPATAGGTAPGPVNSAKVRETQYSYDANRRKTSTTVKNVSNGSTNASSLAYTIADGDIVTRQEYDSVGNVVKEIDGLGNAIFNYHDKLGNKTLQVDAARFVTTWDYDQSGNVIRQTRYAQALPATTTVTTSSTTASLLAAVPQAATDRRIVEYGYDRMNRRSEERRLNVTWSTVNDSSGAISDTTGTLTTKYTFNGLGMVTQLLDASSKATIYAYDKQGRLTRTQSASFMDVDGATVTPTTDTEYNGLGLTSREIQRGKNNAVETDDRISYFYYGKNGLRTSEKDALGNVTSYAYDMMGRMTRQQLDRNTLASGDADFATANVVYNDQTTLSYDLAGRQTEQTTSSKKSTEAGYTTLQSQQTRYSSHGEVIAKGINNGAQEQIEYDNAGRVWRTNSGTDKGAVKVFYYDANGKATLELTSSTDDLRSTAILADSTAASANALLLTGKAQYKYNLYDKLGQLVDSYEAGMNQPAAAATDPYKSAAANVAARTESVATTQDPFTSGSLTAYNTVIGITNNVKFYPPVVQGYGGRPGFDDSATVTLPPFTANGASQVYRVVHTLVVNYTTSTRAGITNQTTTLSSNTTYTSAGTYTTPALVFTQADYFVANRSTEIYQQTPFGEVLIRTDSQRSVSTAPNRGNTSGSYTVTPTGSTANVGRDIRLAGIPLDATRVTLKVRNTSSASNPWIDVGTAATLINGQPVATQFSANWGSLGYGTYEYVYEAFNSTDASLMKNSGVVNLNDNPSSTTTLHYLDWQLGSTLAANSLIHRQQVYNAYGEQTQEIRFKPGATGQSPVSLVTTLSYNALGKLIKKEEPLVSTTLENGFQKDQRPTTQYYHDQLGRLVGTRDANGNLTTYSLLPGSPSSQPIILKEFHADRRLVETAVGSGIFLAKEGVKRNYYDVFGQLRRAANENWTGEGSVLDSTIANQYVTIYTYDAKGQLTSIDRPGAADEDYEYDSVGQRIATRVAPDAQGARPRIRTYYDALGRVTQTTTAVSGRGTAYRYQWVAGILGGGGWRLTTTMADGKTLIDDTDYFGRQRWHKDLGNRAFTYRYNSAGLLIGQSSKTADGRPVDLAPELTLAYSTQDIGFTYYGNGYLKSTIDNTLQTWTEYRYDDRGNRIFEGYARNFGTSASPIWEYYQYSQATYDDANRLTRIWDPKSDINYEYDAMGNRRSVLSKYNDGAGGGLKTQDFWYAYDNMNRFVVTMGALNSSNNTRATSEGDASIKVYRGTSDQGRAITYDNLSQRTGSTSNGGTESYFYDEEGYLKEVKLNGSRIAFRDNDARGNVVALEEATSAGLTRHEFTYDADNLLKTDRELLNGVEKSNTVQNMDALTGLLNTSVRTPTGAGAVSTTTSYLYDYWDSAKQTEIGIKVNNDPKWQSGSTRLYYDVNGHTERVNDLAGNKWFYYSTDADGRIMRREEIDGPTGKPKPNNRASGESVFKFENYYFFNGKQVGDVSNDPGAATTPRDYAQILAQGPGTPADKRKVVTSADFDQNFQPIGPNYPGRTGSVYTVAQNGETLQGIAQAVWGDASLWYLIADANGLTAANELKAGQTLLIPNKVTNLHNNTQTSRPYDPSQALGDISPTLPDPPPPPKKKGCGGIGAIIMVVVTIVVSVVTAGAALAALGPVMAGALGGAVGSIAGQLVGMATGVVDKFSWSSVAMGAVTGAIGGAVVGVGDVAGPWSETFKIAGSNFGTAVLRGVATNVMGQGVSMAVGLQKKFSWTSVAASAAGSAAGFGAGKALQGMNLDFGKAGNQFVSGLASGWAGSMARHEKANWAMIAANSFGNVVGDEIAGSIIQAEREKQQREQRYTLASSDGKQGLKARAGATETWGRGGGNSSSSAPAPSEAPSFDRTAYNNGIPPRPGMTYTDDGWRYLNGAPPIGPLLADAGKYTSLPVTLPYASGGPISANLSLDENPFDSYSASKARQTNFKDFGGVDLTTAFSERALGDFASLMSERSIQNPALRERLSQWGVTPKSFDDGAGVLYFDEYSVDVVLGPNDTPASIIKGLAERSPDKYIGYKPYTRLSDFTMFDMGEVKLGQIYNVRIGSELWGSSIYGDNGTVTLSDYRLEKDRALMQLWTTDASAGLAKGIKDTNGNTMNGDHVVTGGRNLIIEPAETPGVYRITNRGVSEPWGQMSRVGEGFFNNFYGAEGGVQNANWQRMMTGLVKKIETNGGYAVTKPVATYGYVYAGGTETGMVPKYDVKKKPF